MGSVEQIDQIATWLAQFGSSFPHITMSLQPLPTPVIFNLNDGQYVESILFIGFLPLLLLLVLMVALMVYYCIVNFSSDSSKSGKKRCCSANICCYMVSGVFIILLSLAGLAAAMFLCAPASEEIKTAITNLDPANSADAVNKAPNMHSSIKEKLSQYGNSIADELSNDAQTAASWRNDMKTFSEFPTTEFPDDAGNQISGVTNKLKTVDDYRYWASIGLFAFYSLIAILSFIGVCVKSKCMVIGITCALFFALAICHLSLYLQLSGGVILSDYCQNPEEAQKNFIQMPACENDDNLKTLEEFKGTVGGLERAITDLINTMANSPQSYKDLGNELENMMTTIDELVQVKQCDFISQEYEKITQSLCGQYIVGWWAVMLASLLVSVFIAQLLFFAPCVWRTFETYEEHSYGAYDEATPFVRPTSFQRPQYTQRQSVTLSFLRQSNDDLNFSANDKQPPPYTNFN